MITRQATIFALGLVLALGLYSSPQAEGRSRGGRGGPFVEFHLKPLSSFDPLLSGNAMVVGGKGIGMAGRNFALGGAGGGGFAWGAGPNVSYGMGYGGVYAEYTIAGWLSAGMMVGGGGYTVSRIVSETDTTTTLQKISSGGFVLFYPSLQAEIKIRNVSTVALHLGYFLPTNSRLHTVTLGATIYLGRN